MRLVKNLKFEIQTFSFYHLERLLSTSEGRWQLFVYVH